MQDIILASSSRYRAQQLKKLGLPFISAAANIDESSLPEESPADLATRLAQHKALAVLKLHPRSIVLGSDQVASVDAVMLGKPGTMEMAREQLLGMRGKSIEFHTSLFVVDGSTAISHAALDVTTARMRQLSDSEIDRYLQFDKPLDCAGSFKVESLGISLFEQIESSDPTALIGLPLMSVASALRNFGIDVP